MNALHPIIEWKHAIAPSGSSMVRQDSAPFWEALGEGRFVCQYCARCGKFRFPVAPVCPYCLCVEWSWRSLSGRGVVFSWVRYHRSYLPEFEPLMPYCVLTVELEEGVRMIARHTGELPPAISQPVRLVIERWPDGTHVPTFAGLETVLQE